MLFISVKQCGFSACLGTIAKESRPKKVNDLKHTSEAKPNTKRDWIYGWQPQPEVPVYVPPLARSNSGFMRQEGGNNPGFSSQGKSHPTLLSITRAAENRSSGARTRNKESNVTTEYKETKKPTSPFIIFPVKGNQKVRIDISNIYKGTGGNFLKNHK